MIEIIIVVILIAKFVGKYKWFEIFKIFRHWTMYPIIAICLLQIYFTYLMVQGEYWFLEYSKYIKDISFLLCFILVFKYKLINISIFKRINLERNGQLITSLTSPVILGTLFTIVGSQLNKIAIFYNQGKMPVFPTNSLSTGYSKIDMFDKALIFKDFHVLGTYTTKMIWLTDTWDFFYMIMSPGDALIKLLGVFILYYSIVQCNKNNN